MASSMAEIPHALGQFEALGLADQLPDIQADQIGHGERPHGHAEIVQRLVDVVGAGAFLDQEFGLAPIGIESPVGDEPVADPGYHGLLVDRLGYRQGGGQHVGAGLVAAHDFQKLHDVGGAEEMHPDHILRPAGHRGDLVDIEVGGVGGKDGALGRDPIELGEHLLLKVHVLEHRFDHKIGARRIAEADAASDARDASPGLGLRDATLGEPRLDLLAAIGQRAVAGLGADLHQAHGEAVLGKGESDAAAHGAAADHRHLADLARRHALRQIGQAARLALGKEHVAEGAMLRLAQTILEDLDLGLEGLVEGHGERVLDRIDRAQPGVEAAIAPADVGAGQIEYLRIGSRRANCRFPVARPRQIGRGQVPGDNLPGKGDGRRLQVVVDGLVDKAQLLGFLDAEHPRAGDDVERGLEAAEAGKALGPAAAGNDAEADLRKGEDGAPCRPPDIGRPAPSPARRRRRGCGSRRQWAYPRDPWPGRARASRAVLPAGRTRLCPRPRKSSRLGR